MTRASGRLSLSSSSFARTPSFADLFRWLLFRRPPATSFWNTVFDPSSARLHWRTSGHKRVRFLDLGRIDFAPDGPALALDVAAPLEGCVNDRLRPVSRGDNAAIIRKSYRPVRDRVPDAAALFDALKQHGSHFSTEQWTLVARTAERARRGVARW